MLINTENYPRSSASDSYSRQSAFNKTMEIIEAIKIIFINEKRSWLYILSFLALTLIFVFLFAELQVLLSIEPDNIFLYFKVWGTKDWLTIVILSGLISLNLIFFIYSITRGLTQKIITRGLTRIERRLTQNERELTRTYIDSNLQNVMNSDNSSGNHQGKISIIQSTSTTLIGTLSAIFSGILATAFCSSCLVVLFSLLGISFASGVLLLKYRFWIFLISTALLLISLYLISKKLIKNCKC
ncbi:MAG: hypothetical protein KatS3mg095_0406 [Candidatus Parcubacteria bacterium]|nr:MAG: hypothetical protein KatS3mg095_0406 [Candidatus Parcubacteria bacterium]